ncbi:MAG: HAD-IIIC family phosphatase [Vicinamibacteria bacterium]
MSEPDPPRLSRVDDAAFRLEAKARARAHEERLAAGGVARPFRIGLAATFTLDPLRPFLTDALLAAALPPEVALAPYGQLFQACLDPGAAFAFAGPPDAIVLLFRLEDLMAEGLGAAAEGDADALARAEAALDDLARAVGSLRASFAGTIVAALPPFPEPPALDLLDGAAPSSLFARLRVRWSQALLSMPGVRAFDLDALQRFFGAARARDARTAHLYRQPYREAFLALLGERLAATLAGTRVAGRKCIALDCDGTLWGGIVGEDGPEGVDVGDDFPGSAYRDFQRLLVSWRRRGVLLALLSRNDEADVWSVFDARPDMPLRRSDLAAWNIGWGRKTEGLGALARALGIGTDAFVFVDDHPAEVAEMRARRPEVLSLLVPEDPATLVDEILRHRLFEAAETTAEDRARTEMAAAESRRTEESRALSADEFLATLGLAVRVAAAGEAELPRVAQLVAKTNQFNLTTIRRSQDELRALAHDHRVLALWASDRFGDHGLTGVAILRSGEIDTFLLSCRVLGRGVESAFLAAVADEAARGGASRLVARFVPTARNGACAGFLPAHGFREQADGTWAAAVSAVPPCPLHVALRAAAAARPA